MLKPLKWKLLTAFIPLSVLSLFFAGTILWLVLQNTFQQQKAYLTRWVYTELTEQAHTGHLFMEQFFTNLLDNLNRATAHLASRSDLQTFLEKNQPEPLNLILSRFTQVNHLDFAVLFDRDGFVLAKSSPNINDLGFQHQFKKSRLGKHVHQRLFLPHSQNEIIFNGFTSLADICMDMQQAFIEPPDLRSYGPVTLYHITDDFGDILGWVISGRFLQHTISEIKKAIAPQKGVFISFMNGDPLVAVGFPDASLPLTKAQQDEIIRQRHAVIRYQAGGITFMLGCARFNEFEGDVKSIYGLGFPIEPALARSGEIVSLLKKGQVTMTAAMVVIAVLTIVGLIGVSLILARRITAPIEKMTNNLSRLAQDDIDVPLPSRIDTAELQKLADSMAAFRESISKRLEVEKRFRGTIEVLEIAKLKAESSERLKSEFLSTMSHELRTPLNAITVFSKLIAEVLRDDPKKSEWVQLIIDNSDHLMRLVEDMLDVAASSDGRLGLNEAPQNIMTVIRLACVQVMPDAKKKKISITDACDPDLPMVYADGERLRKVFFLIIENSVKFCRPEGRVEIDAVVGDDGGVSVSITDTGIGMDPMTLASAFSAFKQADGSNTREYGGLGIGLTLCKALIERHGGTIEIDSDAGVGTTVTIHLPAERSIEKS